ncbi:class II glutamine amidotransferase [uncultured Piscinibacter sp.]|uniref:class II glutamine amidotransferase n=1 Tax=uncultured Piscinibacter sp. TaxID=1131835 RepID=UPI00261381B9|nr:class II glutamine amidotransferase [uncultured Piscinibacter sp.]
MCQLFALNSNTPSTATFSFTGLSARGGLTGDHVDGYGMAFHEGRACRLFVDEQRASDAALAEFLRRQPIRARSVLAHVRRATQGAVRLENCHPFVREWQGRHWSFCHNGDLKDFTPRLNGSELPVGDTDSERAFCFLLQELRRHFRRRAVPHWKHVAPLLAELAGRVARHGAFNFLLCDGEVLYAHASTRLHALQRQHPFPAAQLVDHDLVLDLAQANGPDDRMVLIATEPLTRNEPWRPFAPGELRVYAAGDEVWRHTPARCPVPAPAFAGRLALA